MKRILVLISPVIFLLFTACGGDDDAPPPVAACANEESLKNLDCLASLAEQICCSEQAAVMESYAGYCQAVTNPQQGAGGYNLPTPPVPPAPTPQVPAAIPGCSPSTQPMDCNTAMTNFELQYKSTYATCMSGATDAWREQQGKAVVTCVGASQGITTTEQFYASPQAQCQATMTYNNFQTTAPTTITSSVPEGTVPPAGGTGGAAPPPIEPGAGTPPPTEPPVGNNPPTEPPPPIGQGFTSGQVVLLNGNSIPEGF